MPESAPEAARGLGCGPAPVFGFRWHIPVIILTSSGAESDVRQAYDLHANCYVIKPVNYIQFKQVIKSIEDFWFTHVALPTG